MHVSVLQENLNKALSIIKPAIGSRMSLPVLSNVCLESDNGRLRLTTTDLELSIQVWVGAKVEQEGAITIPHKILHELVTNLSPERVDLELDVRTQKLHLRSGGTKVKLAGIIADEYPIIRDIENGVSITITGEILRDMVGEVEKVACREDTRPVLTGIYTHFEGNYITMASADGYRLAVRKDMLESEIAEPLTVIIPVRALTTVAKIIGKGKKKGYSSIITMKFDVAGNYMSFDLGDVVVTSNLIEGTFPMYENIVPKSHNTSTTVYTDEFLRACKKAKVFAKDSHNTTRLVIAPSTDGGSGTVHVTAQSSEMDEVSSMIDASITGVAINAAYNVEYLIDACGAMSEDQIIMETIDFTQPLVVRGVVRGEKLYHVIMPMNVGN